jgi:hypothetical protein
VCLAAERGVLTHYAAVVFDEGSARSLVSR